MFDWQAIATLCFVLGAIGYIARAAVLTLTTRKSGGCGSSCSGCGPATTGVKEVQLVTLETQPARSIADRTPLPAARKTDR